AAGRELILSYLLDLENPAEARKYTFLVQDPKLKAVVRNAGSSISELSAEDAAGMGDFYFELVKEPARRNQPELYEKALACYEQFLSLQPDAQDLEATRARIAVASIRDWLETHYRKSRALPMELKQGLVVHLGFDRDEEKGVRDLSGRGHHGRTAGGAWVRDGRGKGNGAYALDGKGAEIQLRPSALGQWKALTYSAWVKAPRQASSTWPAFIGNHTDGAGFNTTFGFYRGTGNLRLEVDTDQGNFIFKGTLTPPVNKWFHVAMVYDGKILREYVDGVPGASFTASGTLKKATTLSLGQEHPNWGSLLGQIDDAMIYNRALSAKHIKKIYELQRGSTRLRVSGGAMDRHLDRITPHLLMDRLENAEGREGINGWRKSAEGNAGLPVVLVNASAKDLLIPQTASAGSVMTHPPSAGGAGLAWRSPSTGTFRVQGRVTDVHACGNSVTWRIDALHGRGQTALGSGSVEPEGSSNFAAGASSRALGSVRLRAGEMLQLVVLPKGDYSCDMSRIDWVITELGGRGRVWNLAKDIVPDLHEKGHGNPHSDSYGNKDVWYFYEVPADQVPE
ncbi:MAG: LamG domain-containing protein, partial [Phycisphaerae bacterium]|nr:LamG domain-containing protein [Phycisphaerae bacterium]